MKTLILSSLLISSMSFANVQTSNEAKGGTINCENKQTRRNRIDQSIYKNLGCQDEKCANVIVVNEITYSHGYRETIKYSIPTNRNEIGEKGLEFYSKEWEANEIEVFDLAGEIPNEFVGQLLVASAYDLVSAPFRAVKRAVDTSKMEKTRKNILTKLTDNYDTILDNFEFLNDEKSKADTRDLEIESCSLFERVFDQNATELEKTGEFINK